MRSPGSVGADESRRLFCALTLPADIRAGLVAWQGTLQHDAARPVVEGNLHVTLAFLGSQPQAVVQDIADELRSAVAVLDGAPVWRPLAYRETRSVGMLVLDDDGELAGALAADLHGRLERLGVYEREARLWLPHVTVLRFRRPPRLSPPLPGLGTFSPSEAAVYHSLLRPGGAQYDVLESMSLGG